VQGARGNPRRFPCLPLLPNRCSRLRSSPPRLFAAGTKYDQSVDCSHRDNLNNYELNQCQGRAIEKADVELGTAYKALMDKTLEAKRPLLVAAERAWIAWRDRECDLTAEVVDGYDKSGTGYGLSWASAAPI